MNKLLLAVAAAGVLATGAFMGACSVEVNNNPTTDSGVTAETGTETDTGAATDSGAKVDAGPVTCKKISVKSLARNPEYGNPADMFSEVSGVPDPGVGDLSLPDQFSIQLYEAEGTTQKPGTYDLASETDYSTCEHCVLVYADVEGGAPTKTFMQASGSFELSVNPSPTTGAIKGSLKNVKLVEVTIDPDSYVSTEVVGGDCLEIDTLAIDTTGGTTGDAGTDAATEAGSSDAATDSGSADSGSADSGSTDSGSTAADSGAASDAAAD